MANIKFAVDGKTVTVNADPSMPLLYALRNDLKMSNPHFGCGLAQCGACTVHLDGQPVRACVTPTSAARGRRVTTIEGLDPKGEHPLQKAWVEAQVPQCGYCQSGQIMSAAALLASKPNPTDADIDSALAGNICRCGTYQRIRAAIHKAAAMKGATR